MQHLAQRIEPDRLFLRDVVLVLDLVEDAEKDLVDKAAESRVESGRGHYGLREKDVSDPSYEDRGERGGRTFQTRARRCKVCVTCCKARSQAE